MIQLSVAYKINNFADGNQCCGNVKRLNLINQRNIYGDASKD